MVTKKNREAATASLVYTYSAQAEAFLVEALAILVGYFFQALAAGGGLDALLLFGRLFETLTALDIGDDAVLFAGLGEALQRSFEGFVRFYNNANHGIPLVGFLA